MQDYSAYLPFAESLADLAGNTARRFFRQTLPVEWKSDDSPVTQADKEIERQLRHAIGDAYPDHGIVGEEEGSTGAQRSLQWVLDPIDGTRSFMTGRPLFTTLISLCVDSTPVLGIIDQPITGERWIGLAGHPSRFNGRAIAARENVSLQHAFMATTSPHYFSESGSVAMNHLRHACADILYGGDAYNYAMLASGHLDIIVEEGLKAYDFCAVVPVIEGAGGKISDWAGAPITLQSNGRVLACANDSLHDAALTYLAQV